MHSIERLQLPPLETELADKSCPELVELSHQYFSRAKDISKGPIVRHFLPKDDQALVLGLEKRAGALLHHAEILWALEIQQKPNPTPQEQQQAELVLWQVKVHKRVASSTPTGMIREGGTVTPGFENGFREILQRVLNELPMPNGKTMSVKAYLHLSPIESTD